jgi:CHAT domain
VIQDRSRPESERRSAAESLASHIRERIANVKALSQSLDLADPILGVTFGPLFQFTSDVPSELVPDAAELRSWLEFAVEFHATAAHVGGEVAFRRLLADEDARRGRWDLAFEVLVPLAIRAQDAGDQLGVILSRIGWIEQARGNTTDAMAWFTRAAEHCETDRARFVLEGVIARVNLSHLCRTLGVVDRATEQQELALKWAEEFDHAEAKFNARLEGVRVALARPGVYDLENEIAELRDLPFAKTDPALDAELQLCELVCAGRKLDSEDADASRVLSERFLELAARESTPQDVSERALFWTISLANRRGDHAIVATAVALSRFAPGQRVARGEAGQQRAQMLYHRAMVEREQLSGHPEDQRRAALQPWFAALEEQFHAVRDEWLAIPAHEAGNAVLHYAGRRDVVVGAMRLALVALGGDSGRERAVDFWLEVQGIGSLTREIALPEPARGDVVGVLLAPDEGLLGFLPSEAGSIVVAIDRDGIAVEVGPNEITMAAQCAAFESHVLTRPPANATKEARAELRRRADVAARAVAAELLPAEIVARVRGWKRVAIVGADLLRTPFVDAMILPGEAEPLGVARVVRHLPSVALGLHLAQRTQHPTNPALRLFAAPIVDAALAKEFGVTAELPFDIAIEARLLREIPRDRREVSTLRDATETAFFAASDPPYATLCVLAHGIQQTARTRPAAFVLTADERADGVVECAAIESLRSPPTVIVAACGAARGPRRYGDEGVQHLGGAFFKAGARSIAISPVDLDYYGTLRLLELLLPALARGEPLANALHEARRVMRSDPRFDHPSLYLTLQAFGG